MKAWQRQIRERRAQQSPSENLFGAWWEDLDTDISKSTVQEITHRTASVIIEEYEWMGRMPAIVWFCYGIYFDGALGGAVVYSPEYGENLGVWDTYGYTGKLILLSRGACVHWAPPHAGSKLIRRSMRLLPRKFEVITATVDETAGEIGTLYQACGFDYVGSMRTDNPRSSGSWSTREGVVVDGVRYTGRTMRHRFGTQSKAMIRARHPNAEFTVEKAKGRYFAFRGNSKTQAANRSAISHLVRPYPKRAKA